MNKTGGTVIGIEPEIKVACDRAAGRAETSPDEPTIRVPAAHKDISARGRVYEYWYRLALEPGETVPRYFTEGREPYGMRASARHWTGYGEVPAGTLLLQHDRGGPINEIWIVHQPVGQEQITLTPCAFNRRADGKISITLPDGSVIAVPNPRKK